MKTEGSGIVDIQNLVSLVHNPDITTILQGWLNVRMHNSAVTRILK